LAAQQPQQPQQPQLAALPAPVGPLDPREQEAKHKMSNLFWHMFNQRQKDLKACTEAFSRRKIGKRSMAVSGIAGQLKMLTTHRRGKSCAENARIL
jgi:hypothetical protein